MLQKFFALRWVALLAALLLATGCAAQRPQLAPGLAYRSVPGAVEELNGRAGTDVMSVRTFDVTACAGRVVNLHAWFMTKGLGGGRESYHGVHFDYEIRAGGRTSWAPDWQEDPATVWTEVKRSWVMPHNMTYGQVRMGLQGVYGTLYLRDFSVSC